MPIFRTSTALALSAAIPALALATPVAAQSVMPVPAQVGATQVETTGPIETPPLGGYSWTSAPQVTTTTALPTFTEERSIGPDGVETITRTRVIRGASPMPQPINPAINTMPYPVMPAPVVLDREQWLAECNRRIDGRSNGDRATIIGGLLGAIGGGVLGNVLADGNRLGETLLGAGAGGLGGALLGSLVGGGKRGDRYDCEAALDGYMAYYAQPGAMRTIGYPYPPTGYRYGYTGAYSYSAECGCQQPQMALIPIRTEVRQRVIVREQIREQLVPGERVIDPPRPTPIKPAAPTKLIKQ